jgi:hypothetical protein
MTLIPWIAWSLSHWRLLAWLAMLAAVVGLGLGLYGLGRRDGVAAEAPKLAAAQVQLRNAQAQAGVTARAARAADRAAISARTFTAKAEEAALTIPVAESLRARCPRAAGAEQVRTAGDLAAFSLRQEAALSVCDGRRAALVAAIDAYNAAQGGSEPAP